MQKIIDFINNNIVKADNNIITFNKDISTTVIYFKLDKYINDDKYKDNVYKFLKEIINMNGNLITIKCNSKTPDLFPVYVPEDGNCLLHSICKSVWFLNDKDFFLRNIIAHLFKSDSVKIFEERWIMSEKIIIIFGRI